MLRMPKFPNLVSNQHLIVQEKLSSYLAKIVGINW